MLARMNDPVQASLHRLQVEDRDYSGKQRLNNICCAQKIDEIQRLDYLLRQAEG